MLHTPCKTETILKNFYGPTKTTTYGRGGSVGYTGAAFGPTSGSPFSSIGN